MAVQKGDVPSKQCSFDVDQLNFFVEAFSEDVPSTQQPINTNERTNGVRLMGSRGSSSISSFTDCFDEVEQPCHKARTEDKQSEVTDASSKR